MKASTSAERRRGTLSFYIALGACAAASGCDRCSPRADAEREASVTTPGVSLPFPRGRAAFVTNNGSDTISAVDRDGEAVVAVTLDVDPSAHEAPHHLAVDAKAGSLFVALAFPPEKAKTKDLHAGHGQGSALGRVARLDLHRLAMTASANVDENPGDIVLTPDGSRLLVTHFDMKRAMDVAARGGASPATMFAHLVMLDAKTLARVGSRALCVAPHGVVTTKDSRTAFVACYGSDELAVVDLASGDLQAARHPIGTSPGVPGVPRYGPYSTTLAPDESYVVVADLEGKDLRVFDRATRRFVPERTVPLEAKAFMPAFVSGSALVVPLQAPDGLARVDMATSRVVARAVLPKEACTLPHAVRVAPDGRVYLVCEGDHVGPGSLLEIEPTTLAVKRRWSVGVLADGIAFGDEGPH